MIREMRTQGESPIGIARSLNRTHSSVYMRLMTLAKNDERDEAAS